MNIKVMATCPCPSALISFKFLLVPLHQQLFHAIHECVVSCHAVLVVEQWKPSSTVFDPMEITTRYDAYPMYHRATAVFLPIEII